MPDATPEQLRQENLQQLAGYDPGFRNTEAFQRATGQSSSSSGAPTPPPGYASWYEYSQSKAGEANLNRTVAQMNKTGTGTYELNPNMQKPQEFNPNAKTLTTNQGTYQNVKGYETTPEGFVKNVSVEQNGLIYTFAPSGNVVAIENQKYRYDQATGEVSDRYSGAKQDLLTIKGKRAAESLGLNVPESPETRGYTEYYAGAVESNVKSDVLNLASGASGSINAILGGAEYIKTTPSGEGFTLEVNPALKGSQSEIGAELGKELGALQKQYPNAVVVELAPGKYSVQPNQATLNEPSYLHSKYLSIGNEITGISFTGEQLEITMQGEGGKEVSKPYSQLTPEQQKAFEANFQGQKSQILLDITERYGQNQSSASGIRWEGGRMINLPTTFNPSDWQSINKEPSIIGPAYEPSVSNVIFKEGNTTLTETASGLGMMYITANAGQAFPTIEQVKFTGQPQSELIREDLGIVFASDVKYTPSGYWEVNLPTITVPTLLGPMTISKPYRVPMAEMGAEGPRLTTPLAEFLRHDYSADISGKVEELENISGLYLKKGSDVGTLPGHTWAMDIRPASFATYLTFGFAEELGKGVMTQINTIGRTAQVQFFGVEDSITPGLIRPQVPRSVQANMELAPNPQISQEQFAYMKSEVEAGLPHAIAFPILVLSFPIADIIGGAASNLLGGAGAKTVIVDAATGKAIPGIPEDIARIMSSNSAKYVEAKTFFRLGERGFIEEISNVGKTTIYHAPPELIGKTLTYTTEHEAISGAWAGKTIISDTTKINVPTGFTKTSPIEYLNLLGATARDTFTGVKPVERVIEQRVAEIGESEAIKGGFRQSWKSPFGPSQESELFVRYVYAPSRSYLNELPGMLSADIRYGSVKGVQESLSPLINYSQAAAEFYGKPIARFAGQASEAMTPAYRAYLEGTRWAITTGSLATFWEGSQGFIQAWESPEGYGKWYDRPSMEPSASTHLAYSINKGLERIASQEGRLHIGEAMIGGFVLGAWEETRELTGKKYRRVEKEVKERLKPWEELSSSINTLNPLTHLENLQRSAERTARYEASVRNYDIYLKSKPVKVESKPADYIWKGREETLNSMKQEFNRKWSDEFIERSRPEPPKQIERAAVRQRYSEAGRMMVRQYEPEVKAQSIQTKEVITGGQREAIAQATKTTPFIAERSASKMAEKMGMRLSEQTASRTAERIATQQAERASERLAVSQAARSAERSATRQATRTAERLAVRQAVRLNLNVGNKKILQGEEPLKERKLKREGSRGKKEVLSDLLSLMHSQNVYGSATSASYKSNPELRNTVDFGKVPTREELENKSGSNQPPKWSLGKGILNMATKRKWSWF